MQETADKKFDKNTFIIITMIFYVKRFVFAPLNFIVFHLIIIISLGDLKYVNHDFYMCYIITSIFIKKVSLFFPHFRNSMQRPTFLPDSFYVM